MIQLEICVETIESAITAVQGGADRIELCSALAVGGLTPGEGLVAACRDAAPETPIMMMCRSRAGDFVLSANDLNIMLRDIETAKRCGVHGVVLGALTREGRIDRPAIGQLVAAARPLSITFHRAIDFTTQPLESLNELIELGVDRVLTSGQAATAAAGVDLIRRMVEVAGRQLVVIAGGGVDYRNVQSLVEVANVAEVHASASLAVETGSSPAWLHCGDLRRTALAKVQQLRNQLDKLT